MIVDGLCLPLNQHYEIGGTWAHSKVYKAITISFQINPKCPPEDGGIGAIIETNRKANPYNS
jgi:hypothetical protein